MSAALLTQHATGVRHVVLPFASCMAVPYFSALCNKERAFREKKVIGHKMCVLNFSASLSEIFLILRIIQRDILR